MDIPFKKILFDKEMMIFMMDLHHELVVTDIIFTVDKSRLNIFGEKQTNKQTKNKNKQTNKQQQQQQIKNLCLYKNNCWPEKSQFLCFNYQIYNSDHQQHGFIFHD